MTTTTRSLTDLISLIRPPVSYIFAFWCAEKKSVYLVGCWTAWPANWQQTCRQVINHNIFLSLFFFTSFKTKCVYQWRRVMSTESTCHSITIFLIWVWALMGVFRRCQIMPGVFNFVPSHNICPHGKPAQYRCHSINSPIVRRLCIRIFVHRFVCLMRCGKFERFTRKRVDAQKIMKARRAVSIN